MPTTDRPEDDRDADQDRDSDDRVNLEGATPDAGIVGTPGEREQAGPERENGRRDHPEHRKDDAGPRARIAAGYNERSLDVRVLAAQGDQRWKDQDVREGRGRDDQAKHSREVAVQSATGDEEGDEHEDRGDDPGEHVHHDRGAESGREVAELLRAGA